MVVIVKLNQLFSMEEERLKLAVPIIQDQEAELLIFALVKIPYMLE